jgi:hypothetical protein
LGQFVGAGVVERNSDLICEGFEYGNIIVEECAYFAGLNIERADDARTNFERDACFCACFWQQRVGAVDGVDGGVVDNQGFPLPVTLPMIDFDPTASECCGRFISSPASPVDSRRMALNPVSSTVKIETW